MEKPDLQTTHPTTTTATTRGLFDDHVPAKPCWYVRFCKPLWIGRVFLSYRIIRGTTSCTIGHSLRHAWNITV